MLLRLFVAKAHSQLRYGCEAHSHLSYYYEAHSQLRYECEAHSHLSYYYDLIYYGGWLHGGHQKTVKIGGGWSMTCIIN